MFIPGWWFQTCFVFHFIYGIIIILPIDKLIFWKRWLLHHCTTNQIHVYHGLFHMMIWYIIYIYIYTYIIYIIYIIYMLYIYIHIIYIIYIRMGDDSTKTCSRKWWDDLDDLEPGKNAVTFGEGFEGQRPQYIDGGFIYPLVICYIMGRFYGIWWDIMGYMMV